VLGQFETLIQVKRSSHAPPLGGPPPGPGPRQARAPAMFSLIFHDRHLAPTLGGPMSFLL